MCLAEIGSWREAVSKVSHCTSLHSLTVNIDTTVYDFPDEPFEYSAWCRVMELLEVIPSSVSIFTFKTNDLKETLGRSTRDVDWNQLDEILCRREKLESVVFNFTSYKLVPCYQDLGALAEFLGVRLPRTQSLGVLRIVSTQVGMVRVPFHLLSHSMKLMVSSAGFSCAVAAPIYFMRRSCIPR